MTEIGALRVRAAPRETNLTFSTYLVYVVALVGVILRFLPEQVQTPQHPAIFASVEVEDEKPVNMMKRKEGKKKVRGRGRFVL